MDGKYLFGSEVFFHNGKMMTQTDVREWSILNMKIFSQKVR